MHDGMQYEQIQGQGHEPMKVGNTEGRHYQRYSLCSWHPKNRQVIIDDVTIRMSAMVCNRQYLTIDETW